MKKEFERLTRRHENADVKREKHIHTLPCSSSGRLCGSMVKQTCGSRVSAAGPQNPS